MLVLYWRKFGRIWKWEYGTVEEKNGEIKKFLWIGTAHTAELGDQSNSALLKESDKFFLLPPEIDMEREKGDSNRKIEINPDTVLRGGFGKRDGQTVAEASFDIKDGGKIFPADIELFWF